VVNESREYSKRALKDFELIDRAVVDGEQAAFGDLMKRYKKPVYHMILKMVRNVDDAEDLTIESFSKAFKSLHKFKKDYTFSTWLFRIATNNTIDFIRKKRLDTISIHSAYTDDNGESVGLEVVDRKMDPEEAAIDLQKRELVRVFVEKLPPRYRKLVMLRYFDELSYEEIAQEMESPLGTVKAQLHRARELLLELVKNNKDYI
jgi:RNA polymerase sigma-70 factor (ECF subfamily)